jgi:lipoprotein-anchoring transpeptidase ErfK/SrfK
MTLLPILIVSGLLAQSPAPQPAGARRQEPRGRSALLSPADAQTTAERAAAELTANLQLQVMLDRAGFSPGTIDGRNGPNTKKALAQYDRQNAGAGLPSIEALTTYTITAEDAEGPFAPSIPRDLMEQAALPALAYTSPLEALAERFHTTPALLQRLNPSARFAAGEQIQVPNVEPLIVPVDKPEISPDARAVEKKAAAERPAGTAGRRGDASGRSTAATKQPNTIAERPDVVVTVTTSTSALTVRDVSGRILLYAPVTTGSQHDPLPIGEWKVNGIQFNPKFNYNPELFWDADPAHSKARIPPGPNNPVGLVWIDLSREHYGIHGTPEPSTIGRTESHGCVRLTNWDALKLAGLVKPGTKVVFEE